MEKLATQGKKQHVNEEETEKILKTLSEEKWIRRGGRAILLINTSTCILKSSTIKIKKNNRLNLFSPECPSRTTWTLSNGPNLKS